MKTEANCGGRLFFEETAIVFFKTFEGTGDVASARYSFKGIVEPSGFLTHVVNVIVLILFANH